MALSFSRCVRVTLSALREGEELDVIPTANSLWMAHLEQKMALN